MRIGFRLGAETFVLSLADGRIENRRSPIERTDVEVTGGATAVAAAVYGGVPIEALEQEGAIRVEGDRDLFRTFTTLFPLPSPPPADDELHVYYSFGHKQAMPEAMPPLVLDVWRHLAVTPFGTVAAGGRLYVDVTPLLGAQVQLGQRERCRRRTRRQFGHDGPLSQPWLQTP